MDLFPEEMRDTHFAVGRLDKDTEGLLLITDDGVLTHKLLSPESKVSKTYFFWAEGALDEEKLGELTRGVKIFRNREDKTAPAKIEILEHKTVGEIEEPIDYDTARVGTRRLLRPAVSGLVTITEGKKHQVKRMIRYAGAKVIYLKRLSMATLALDPELPKGEYRPLTEGEISSLREIAAGIDI
jgi:16S rRNA pseudouridine516 synthase